MDPVHVQLWTGDDEDQEILPSVCFVPANFVDEPFANYWTRLEIFASIGPGSVLLVEGPTSTSAFEACLRRYSPELPFLQADIWTKSKKGVEELHPVDEGDLSKALREVKVPSADSLEAVSLDLTMRKTKR